MRHLTLFLCFLFLIPVAQAQHSFFPARQAGWWTLGLDGGWAYQSADVRTQWNGWGAGLTLGKNLAYRPGGAFSFDIRGRFLFSRSYGAGSKQSFGILKNDALNGSRNNGTNYLYDVSAPNDSSFVFQNFRNTMGELGLEGVLTFNRLRERTGVVLALFGGLGLDLYRTKIDQKDALGNEYNYFNINEDDSRRAILSDLKQLRDGSFETVADGFENNQIRLGLMPGAGIELGYQVAPRFVIGVGHKITFSRTDILDGQQWNNTNTATASNDWHHYTNIHFRWDLVERERKMEPPVITITTPSVNPYVTQSSIENLRANIRNVRNAADLQCTLNGSNQPFYFRNGELSGVMHLQPGRNEVRITASNPAGRDDASAIIIWEDRRIPPSPPIPPPPPVRRDPEVRITQPARSPFSTDRDNIGLVAIVNNVRDRRDVRVLVNGSEVSFSLAEDLEASIRLREGRNIIRVEAQTPDGRASDEVEVVRERQQPQGQKPSVEITRPRSTSERTTEKNYAFTATVLRVDSKDDVTFYLNGNILRNFTFNTRNGQLQADLSLNRGNNDVTVRAKNRYGDADASATLIFENEINVQRRPDVAISDPANGSKVAQADVVLRASVKYINQKEQIVVTLNGVGVRNFDFNQQTQSIQANLRLKEGENLIQVRASNADGSDEDEVRVRHQLNLPKPAIRITDPVGILNTSTTSSYLVKAVSEHVASRNEVVFEVNKKAVAFDFDASNGKISSNIVLKEGDNLVSITVSNASGTNQASCTIRYSAPKAPECVINSPENNSETRVKACDLQATVKNVAAKEAIKVYQNGREKPFEFNVATQKVTAKLALDEGANTLRVVVSTSSGNAEATVAVRYLVPKAPKVNILTPKNQSSFTEANVQLSARVENVTNSNQVKVRHNKLNISAFTLDKGGNLSASVKLVEGSNTLTVEATTADGAHQDVVTVTYKPVAAPPPPTPALKPAVNITVPKRSGITVSNPAYTVKATVNNIEDAAQLKVTFNGQTLTVFQFSPLTGNLSIPVTLKEGKNNLQIDASTRTGNASARTEINYVKVNQEPAPEIEIESASQPAVSPFNPNEASSQILAKTKYVTDKGQISIKVNDVALTNFDFDATTGKLNFIIRLKKGVNQVEVRVKTDQGEDTDTISVRFD